MATGTTDKAAATTSSQVTAAAAITPEKRGWRWTTPFGVTKDFIKGTGIGLGNGLSRGASIGIKLGLVAGTIAFFAPVVPVFMTIATAIGLPGVGVAGFDALLAGGLYALGGAAVGAVFGGAMGTLTGGAYELKLRGRREKYADELAERAEMRSRQRVRSPNANWRDYAKAVRQEQKDWLTNQYYFGNEVANEQALNMQQQQSWVDKVGASRQQYDRSR